MGITACRFMVPSLSAKAIEKLAASGAVTATKTAGGAWQIDREALAGYAKRNGLPWQEFRHR